MMLLMVVVAVVVGRMEVQEWMLITLLVQLPMGEPMVVEEEEGAQACMD